MRSYADVRRVFRDARQRGALVTVPTDSPLSTHMRTATGTGSQVRLVFDVDADVRPWFQVLSDCRRTPDGYEFDRDFFFPQSAVSERHTFRASAARLARGCRIGSGVDQAADTAAGVFGVSPADDPTKLLDGRRHIP